MIKPPPEWFTVRADQPSLWSTDVRVSAEGVEWMARLWASPVTHPMMRYLWAAFLSSEAHFRERLPGVRWGKFTPWQLIQFLHVGTGVARGMAECTPDLPELPRAAKARIYFHALLIAALRHATETGVPTEVYDGDGEVPAVRWAVMKALSGAVCYAMTPPVAAELRRRGSGHVGYGVAQLELLRRAENLPPVFGDAASAAVNGLVRATKRQVKQTLRKRGLDDSQIMDFLEGLAGQAAIMHQISAR